MGGLGAVVGRGKGERLLITVRHVRNRDVACLTCKIDVGVEFAEDLYRRGKKQFCKAPIHSLKKNIKTLEVLVA